MENLYTTGKYIKQNPGYHIEDSEFKSNNFIKILKKNDFNFHQIHNVIDVGCGAGIILKIFQNSNLFNNKTNFKGFDINNEIINFANKEKNKTLNFYCEDFFKSNSYGESDLIICADVYEHIEDYIGFLKKLLPSGKFFLFNIPLDISVRTLLTNKVINENFKKVGHLHFFNKNIARSLLEYCNYDIIDTLYAKNFLALKKKSFKQKLLSIPVKIFDKISEDLSASIFGGYSLVVLAKKRWNT